MTILGIITDLERMGDLAEDIAKRAVALLELPFMDTPVKLEQMANLTVALVRQALDAFVNLDMGEAQLVCWKDDEVDRLNEELIAELIQTMKGQPDLVEPALSLFSAVRHLERIADHATNIAEDVIYLVECVIVRHNPAAVLVPDSP